MTDPGPVTFVPVWLSPADVRSWLKLPAGQDDDLVRRCAAAVEPEVERWRADRWSTPDPDADPPTPRMYVPDAQVYEAAVMLAAKVFRRRNSPAGIVEGFGDAVTYVARYDPEIQRALRQGAWTMPGVG